MNEVEKKIEKLIDFLNEKEVRDEGTFFFVKDEYYEDDDRKKFVEMVKSLIQEERQGAVEGFWKWYIHEGQDLLGSGEDVTGVYLKSLEDKDKEGK